jgi:hypothetical protein
MKQKVSETDLKRGRKGGESILNGRSVQACEYHASRGPGTSGNTSARTPNDSAKFLHGCPRSYKESTGTVLQIFSQLPSTSFPVNCWLLILPVVST